jgi:uncharacterized protein (TIGR02996 family)
MDLLAQHEAFLRAIFDAPDDDTPRLVYADFLQENGDEDRAAYIRYACELAGCADDDPRREPILAAATQLLRQHPPPDAWPWANDRTVRGFPLPSWGVIAVGDLADVDRLRDSVVRWVPELYGTKSVRMIPPPQLDDSLLDVLFSLPFIRQVSELDLSGHEREASPKEAIPAYLHTLLTEFVLEPVISTVGVEALARHKSARRITSLDLRNNNLDNDAARALVASPYLDNLKRLQLLEGNRLRGKVWQQVIERFGEDVVG